MHAGGVRVGGPRGRHGADGHRAAPHDRAQPLGHLGARILRHLDAVACAAVHAERLDVGVLRLGHGVEELGVVGVAARGDHHDGRLHLQHVAVLLLSQHAFHLAVFHDELAAERVEVRLHAQLLGLGAEALHEVAAGAGVVALVVDVPHLRAHADGDVALELDAVALQPVDGLGRLAEEVLVQLVLGDPVVVVQAGVDGVLHAVGGVGAVGAGELHAAVGLGEVRFEAGHALGADERTAVAAQTLDDDGLEAQVDGLDSRRGARAARADDAYVGLHGLLRLAQLGDAPDGVVGCVACCGARFGALCRSVGRALLGLLRPAARQRSTGESRGQDAGACEKGTPAQVVGRCAHDAPPCLPPMRGSG